MRMSLKSFSTPLTRNRFSAALTSFAAAGEKSTFNEGNGASFVHPAVAPVAMSHSGM
ncbi:MAG: hypothetical protein HY403_09485 [Elusimicrobia bacterium]|nr:hypothetical protein [Elusimicrobiota bacterium]